MPIFTTDRTDSWLPTQLPAQLAALGELYRHALESRASAELAGVGWRLNAALAFAARMAPLPHLADLTGLSVEQLTSVLREFADDDAGTVAS